MAGTNKGQTHPRRPSCTETPTTAVMGNMVMSESESQMQNGSAAARAGPIVAFDFDGTLTVRDSFQAFLRWRAGAFEFHVGLLRLIPAAVAYLGHRSRARLKAAMVRVYLKGLPREVLEREASEFAASNAPLLLRPDALKAWRRHRQDGARMVIVTASPDILVWPFARGLGADLLIGTRLTLSEDGRVAGTLASANCRGIEKVNRLREAFGDDVRLLAAYGDTAGDREMLELAEDRFMRLFQGKPMPTVGAA